MSGKLTINNELDALIARAIEAAQDKQLVKTKTKKFSTASIMQDLGKSRQTFNRQRKNPENFTIGEIIKLSQILQVDRQTLYDVVDRIASENLDLDALALSPSLPEELEKLTQLDKEDLKALAEVTQEKIKALHKIGRAHV